jgi:hypothetical protein
VAFGRHASPDTRFRRRSGSRALRIRIGARAERLAGAAVRRCRCTSRLSKPTMPRCSIGFRAALASRNDAVYLSELIAGADSLWRTAKLVSADGEAWLLTYDSSPSGQGIGSNTVVLYDCAPFELAPHLSGQEQRLLQVVCTHDEPCGRGCASDPAARSTARGRTCSDSFEVRCRRRMEHSSQLCAAPCGANCCRPASGDVCHVSRVRVDCTRCGQMRRAPQPSL